MNNPADVRWYRDKKLMHRQTWKDGKPDPIPPAENVPVSDANRDERAGLWERMHKVLGRTCWRDPSMPSMQGLSQRAQAETAMMQALSAARAWRDRRERQGATQWTVQDEIACRVLDAQDVGPDILASLLFRQPVNGVRVTRHLAAALIEFRRSLARIAPQSLSDGAWSVFMAQVYGNKPKRPRTMRWEDWQTVEQMGAKILWNSGEQTMRGISEVLK